MPGEDRLAYEVDFHNSTRERQEARRLPSRMIEGILDEASLYFYGLVKEKCLVKNVLDYGCGEGGLVGRLLSWGAGKITAIDISPGMVERAASAIKDQRVNFLAMNGERMEFADNSFDLVAGSAILHHLDLHKAFREIHRVLKPGGEAVFLEPLGNNPFINLFRRLTPGARTPFECPLRKNDISLARQIFSEVKSREFVFTVLFILPLRCFLPGKIFLSLSKICRSMDRVLSRYVPVTRFLHWISVIEMKK